MNISSAKRKLKYAMLNEDSVLLSSKHGIGKSAIVLQFCKENKYHFEPLFLSHQEVGDLIGIPKTKILDGETITYWTKPEWFKRIEIAAKNGIKSVLFLDELNRSQQDVLQSALQLVLDGQIHDHKLPVGDLRTFIVSAINPSDEYQTSELDPALLDRFLKLKIEVDVNSWLEWSKSENINTLVINFIKQNNEFLHWTPRQVDDEFDSCGSSPRSWDKLSGYINLYISGVLPEEDLFDIIKGKIGKHIGYIFFSFVNSDNNINTNNIIKLINQLRKFKATDIEYSNGVREFIKDIEGIQKLQLAEQILKLSINNNNYKYILIYLYALDIEYLIPILKTLKDENINAYKKLTESDYINNKELFKKVTNLLI